MPPTSVIFQFLHRFFGVLVLTFCFTRLAHFQFQWTFFELGCIIGALSLGFYAANLALNLFANTNLLSLADKVSIILSLTFGGIAFSFGQDFLTTSGGAFLLGLGIGLFDKIALPIQNKSFDKASWVFVGIFSLSTAFFPVLGLGILAILLILLVFFLLQSPLNWQEETVLQKKVPFSFKEIPLGIFVLLSIGWMPFLFPQQDNLYGIGILIGILLFLSLKTKIPTEITCLLMALSLGVGTLIAAPIGIIVAIITVALGLYLGIRFQPMVYLIFGLLVPILGYFSEENLGHQLQYMDSITYLNQNLPTLHQLKQEFPEAATAEYAIVDALKPFAVQGYFDKDLHLNAFRKIQRLNPPIEIPPLKLAQNYFKQQIQGVQMPLLISLSAFGLCLGIYMLFFKPKTF